MKMNVYRELFIREFMNSRPDNFSRGGLNALFDYFEELEAELDEHTEFDVISICCDYSEYKNLKEFQDYYGTGYTSMDAISEVTTVIDIPTTKGFITYTTYLIQKKGGKRNEN